MNFNIYPYYSNAEKDLLGKESCINSELLKNSKITFQLHTKGLGQDAYNVFISPKQQVIFVEDLQDNKEHQKALLPDKEIIDTLSVGKSKKASPVFVKLMLNKIKMYNYNPKKNNLLKTNEKSSKN